MMFDLPNGTAKAPKSDEMIWLSEKGVASCDGSALFNLQSVDVERA